MCDGFEELGSPFYGQLHMKESGQNLETNNTKKCFNCLL